MGEWMNLNRIIVIGLLLSLFVGLASATEPTDVIDTVDTIDDTLTALEIVNEGKRDLQRLQDDPTNTTRLQDAVERPFDIMFGGDIHDAEGVKRSMYGYIIIGVIVTIAPLIMALIKGLKG